MKIDLSHIKRNVDAGRIMSQNHPIFPLEVYNYTLQTQYSADWDEMTLLARGLVLDNTGEVVGRSFKKFFNYSEVAGKGVIPWNEKVIVQEKMDGSLCTLFNYAGRWIMASKGSFISDQSQKAMEIVQRNYNLDNFDTSLSYAMEVIYPENRIVVNYGNVEKVVFLGASTSDYELGWDAAHAAFLSAGIPESDIVKTERFDSFSEELLLKLQAQNLDNFEGYIIRFAPSNYRVKVKFEEYVRLHKIMTEVSTTSVWDMLAHNQSVDEALQNVPDEFFDRIKEYEAELMSEFASIKEMCELEFKGLRSWYDNRAEFARYAKNFKYASVLFKMLDGKEYESLIWNIIRPQFRKL